MEPCAPGVLVNCGEYAQRHGQCAAAILESDHRLFAMAHGMQK
jgi:hypothetical protein